MTTLLENPLPVILVGILAEAVLAIALLRSGRGVLLGVMAAVLALVLAGVALEWLVVTDVERVEATIEGAAAALEANDQARLLHSGQFLADSAFEVRALVRWGLKRAEFTKVNVTRLEIKINSLTSPPTAKARIKGIAFFKDRRGEYPYRSHPIDDLTLGLRLESDRWLITGYQWRDDPRRR